MDGAARHDPGVPMTHRTPRPRGALAVVAALGAGGAVGLAGVGLGLLPATADSACATYLATAAADGVRTYAAAPGASPTDVDGAGPAAQAEIQDPSRSEAFAGAPSSNAAAGNAGAANVDATQVPVFAISQYPSTPKAGSSSPAATLSSTSDERSSTAKAAAGGPADDQLAAGQASASASASCADDGTTKAVADSVTQMIDVEGVLRIASVHSTATAAISPSGERTLDGKIALEGVTVAGQGVGVSDKGIVVGDAPTALPADNPLVKALADAGITVHTVGVAKNDQDGNVVAPALEITVTRAVPGVGTGPVSTTYTFGRAFARASATPGDSASTPDLVVGADEGTSPDALGPDALSAPAATDSGSSAGPDLSASGPTSAGAAPSGGRAASPSADTPSVALPAQRISNASTASVYPAVALGALVLVAAGVVFKFLGVRLRWN